ncbi:MAG: NAD(P)/FAD-dependent oxidoreductase [Acidimicrobiales bacterium]
MYSANPFSGTAAIVGAGPAGLMAAETLGQAGLAVTIYDHMPSPGRKFMLAGRGGLNITHSESIEEFLDKYGPQSGPLEAALETFNPDDLREWCAGLGEPTFVGTSGRVFPKSFRATPLLRAWLQRLENMGVAFELHHRWEGWTGAPGHEHLRFVDAAGESVEVASDVRVFALGGASWPRVGSDGGWVDHFVARGIDVRPLRATNCGVRVDWTGVMIERFAGVPLKNVAVSVGGDSVRGDVMVTETGLEGGPIYAHSPAVRDALDRDGRCVIRFDLQPDLSYRQLLMRLSERRRNKDSLSTLLRRAGFAPPAIGLMREAMGNDLPTSDEGLASLAKLVPVLTTSLMPIERAISSAGGVLFDEFDESFMLHKLPGTFVTGEMLDWEAPTGGYLLQACFSTAVAAARGAVNWLRVCSQG